MLSWSFSLSRHLLTMLLPSYGLLASTLIPLLLAGGTAAQDARSRAQTALTVLQDWYNPSTGLWNTCGWWNGANVMTAIADLAAVDPSTMDIATYVFNNTLIQAPAVNPHPGPEIKTNSKRHEMSARASSPVNASQWLDSAYDDDGWWALAWIAAYDVTEDNIYLELAEGIFQALVSQPCIIHRVSFTHTNLQTAAWGTRCGGGGIPWNPTDDYVNAITNELFLSVAAHLANRVPSKRQEYIRWAQREWDWFAAQGFIGQNGTINDGLLNNCQNNGATV